MLTHVINVLTSDDFQILRQSRSDHVLNAFNIVRTLADHGLQVEANCYPSAGSLVSVGAPVPRGFELSPFF